MTSTLKYTLLLLMAACYLTADSAERQPTVILIPGIGGSVLNTCQSGPKFEDKRTVIVADCRRVYLDYVYADQMSKEYLISKFDPKSLKTSSVKNYTLSVSWKNDGLDAIDTLDPDLWFFSYRSWYFHETILDFKRLLPNVTLVGYPYDWRQHVCEESILTNLHSLFKRNSPPFVIVTHSMGALVLRCALLRYPELADVIKGVVLIAPPLGGSFMAIQAVLWGYDFGIPYTWMGGMKTDTSRSVALGIGSVPCLLPTGNRTFISYRTLDGKNVTIDKDELVDFLSEATGNSTSHYSIGSVWSTKPIPKLPTTVVIGTEIGTPIGYDIPQPISQPSDAIKYPMNNKAIRYGPGDGTVPSEWVEEAIQKLVPGSSIRKYLGSKNHVDMLSDDDLIKDISDIIKGYL